MGAGKIIQQKQRGSEGRKRGGGVGVVGREKQVQGEK